MATDKLVTVEHLPDLAAPAIAAAVDPLQDQIDAIAQAQVSGVIGFATRAELLADLDYAAGTVAYVTNDTDSEYNGTYRKVGESGSGTWEQSSRGWDAQDVAGLIGGADVSPQTLRQWAESEAYEPTAITRNAEGVVTSATVRWPDGSTGAMTATATNATWLTIDAYTITHDASGRTVTQPAVTRDPQTGGVLIKPELTVS